jgi:hypothetical protein
MVIVHVVAHRDDIPSRRRRPSCPPLKCLRRRPYYRTNNSNLAVRQFESNRVLTGRNLSLDRLDERDVVEQVEHKSRTTFSLNLQGTPKLTSLKFSNRASDGLMP